MCEILGEEHVEPEPDSDDENSDINTILNSSLNESMIKKKLNKLNPLTRENMVMMFRRVTSNETDT